MSRIFIVALATLCFSSAHAQTGDDLTELERAVKELKQQMQELREEQRSEPQNRTLFRSNQVNVQVINKNGQELVLEERNGGERKVTLNGQLVPKDRVTIDGGRITILNERGEPIFEHQGVTITKPPVNWGWQELKPRREVEKRPVIGITMKPVSPELAYHLDLEPGRCVLVERVAEGQPASQAGLQQYDVIVAMNGQNGVHPVNLRELIADSKAGDRIDLTVLRRGEQLNFTLTVAEREIHPGHEFFNFGSEEVPHLRVNPFGQWKFSEDLDDFHGQWEPFFRNFSNERMHDHHQEMLKEHQRLLEQLHRDFEHRFKRLEDRLPDPKTGKPREL